MKMLPNTAARICWGLEKLWDQNINQNCSCIVKKSLLLFTRSFGDPYGRLRDYFALYLHVQDSWVICENQHNSKIMHNFIMMQVATSCMMSCLTDSLNTLFLSFSLVLQHYQPYQISSCHLSILSFSHCLSILN